jgi:hypothetical protein
VVPEPPAPSPIPIAPEALMRDRFMRPGDMAQTIATHLPTLQHFSNEVIPALRETAAEERGLRRTGERA